MHNAGLNTGKMHCDQNVTGASRPDQRFYGSYSDQIEFRVTKVK